MTLRGLVSNAVSFRCVLCFFRLGQLQSGSVVAMPDPFVVGDRQRVLFYKSVSDSVLGFGVGCHGSTIAEVLS